MARRASETREERGPDTRAVPDFALDRHLFYWITQLLDRRDRELAAALKGFRLRAPEWRALASLYSRHRLSMSDLAETTSIERTTLSRIVERMVRAGWVSRLTDTSDARVTRLALTAEGERLFARIWPAVSRVNDAMIAGLPAPAVDLVRWALEEMCRNFDALAKSDSRRDVA